MPIECHCGSEFLIDNCCLKFIKHDNKPTTALELMRSRYTAYVLNEVDYLQKTTAQNALKNFNKLEISKWALENKWTRLKILKTEKGQKNHSEGIVEFKAYYYDKSDGLQCHHERSNFVKYNNQWYYLKGKVY